MKNNLKNYPYLLNDPHIYIYIYIYIYIKSLMCLNVTDKVYTVTFSGIISWLLICSNVKIVIH